MNFDHSRNVRWLFIIQNIVINIFIVRQFINSLWRNFDNWAVIIFCVVRIKKSSAFIILSISFNEKTLRLAIICKTQSPVESYYSLYSLFYKGAQVTLTFRDKPKPNQTFHYTRLIPLQVSRVVGGAHLRVIAPGLTVCCYTENAATVASRWQHCARFGRPGRDSYPGIPRRSHEP